MNSKYEGILAGLLACVVILGIVIGGRFLIDFYNNLNEARDQQCMTKYGQEFHYSPVLGEPYCINDKTGEGKWSL
jgi:hypothetical protein